jgi:hypothetical protein
VVPFPALKYQAPEGKKHMKTLSYAMTTPELADLLARMQASHYTVERDNAAGTAVASFQGTAILRALKIQNGRWLVRADPAIISPVPEMGPS